MNRSVKKNRETPDRRERPRATVESGAAGIAGLLALCADPAARERLALDGAAVVVAISTEGATDPESWERCVGRPLPR